MPKFALAANDEELGDRFSVKTLSGVALAKAKKSHGTPMCRVTTWRGE